MSAATDKVKLQFAHRDRVARISLAAPPANVIDAPMIEGLERAFDAIATRPGLKVVVLDAEGPHFSFGASIEEHLPGTIAGALDRLHHILQRLVAVAAPTLAAVRGQCLGGGFELVLGCDLILAEESAQFGTPEIKLGVFAPAASALLPLRIGGGAAATSLLTGASWSGTQAHGLGLVNGVAPDGKLATTVGAWLKESFLPRSAVGLRHAALALREPRRRALERDLRDLEKRYLEQLMPEPDSVEGIRAFLEKRQPRWRGASPQ